MKNTLVAVISALSILFPATAFSGGYHGHGHRHWHNHRAPIVVHKYHHNHSNWVAPLIIGGVVGAAIANSRTDTPAPVIIQQPATVLSTDNNNQVIVNGVVYHLRVVIIDDREQLVLVPIK